MADRPISRRRLFAEIGSATVLASAALTLGRSRMPAAATGGRVARVNPSVRLGRLGPRALGFSVERSVLSTPLFDDANAALVELFRLLGPGMLRVGANSVDRVPWDRFAARATPGAVGPPDLRALRRFADAADWDVLHGLPFVLAGSSSDTAADEAADAVGALETRLSALEFGNEPDLYGAVAAYRALAGTPSLFRTRWRDFAWAVLGAAPNTGLSGPGCCLLSSIDAWTVPFTHGETDALTWVTQHYYRGFGGSNQTIETLLAPDPAFDASLGVLATSAAATGADGFRITETNSFANGGMPGVSNTFASALWAIGLHLDATAAGCAGLHFHNSGTGAGYPAIVQVDGVVREIRPLFYGLALLGSLGEATHLAVDTSGLPATTGIHAFLGDDGDLRVVIRNLAAESTTVVDVDLGVSLSSASVERLQADALHATTGVTFRGATINPDGSFSPNADDGVPVSGATVTVAVPAASAVIVRAHPSAPIPGPATTVPARSTLVPTTSTAMVPSSGALEPAHPVSREPDFVG